MIHAQVTGSGPDVVLVHGVTDNLGTWGRVVPLLAGHARVHAVDLPGHGRSPIPDRAQSVAEMARAVADYLAAARIERCVVVGNSLGGGVALMLAASAPERVGGVVTLAAIGAPFGLPLRLRVLRIPGGTEMMRLAACVPRLAGLSMGFMFHRGFAIPRETVLAYWSGWRARGRARYVRALMRALDVAEPAPVLPTIRAAVHVVHGAEDRVIPANVAREIAAAIPGARLTLMERTGHAPQNEHPDATAAIIRDLIR